MKVRKMTRKEVKAWAHEYGIKMRWYHSVSYVREKVIKVVLSRAETKFRVLNEGRILKALNGN